MNEKFGAFIAGLYVMGYIWVVVDNITNIHLFNIVGIAVICLGVLYFSYFGTSRFTLGYKKII